MSTDPKPITSTGTIGTFLTKGGCSHTLFRVLNRAYGQSLEPEEKASDQLVGGLASHGYQCGMIWGSALAAGAEAFRRYGAGAEAETKTIFAAQRIVDAFRELAGVTDCADITGIDETLTPMQLTKYFLFKGGAVGCFGMAAHYAPVALREINTAFAEMRADVPAGPVSCAAVLARKMGASDGHAAMAAGFAGGIGLSGGACGALGAAVWLSELENVNAGGKVAFKSKPALNRISRFLKCTDYEFECSKIVGRRFASVADHARHVCDGGCAPLIDELAK